MEDDSMEELLEQLGGDLENNPEMETKLQYEEKRVISVTRLQARTRGYLARNPKSLIFFSTTSTEGESFFWVFFWVFVLNSSTKQIYIL